MCQLIATALNFGMNLYLIPRHSWLGAAIASLITDGSLAILTWTVFLWLRNRERVTAPSIAAQSV
jgi:O-antigen/teichoic acid export membrane protein